METRGRGHFDVTLWGGRKWKTSCSKTESQFREGSYAQKALARMIKGRKGGPYNRLMRKGEGRRLFESIVDHRLA